MAASIAFWVDHNGCNLQPRREKRGQNVVRETYSGCRAGTQVVLYTLLDGGHGWLGSNRGDRPSPSLAAAEVLWAFFAEHTATGSLR